MDCLGAGTDIWPCWGPVVGSIHANSQYDLACCVHDPSPSACSITWGLAALKPCHQLANSNNQSSGNSPDRRAATPTGSNRFVSSGINKAHPTTPVPVDNPSRKPLYGICTTATVARPSKGDVLAMDLSPKEDGQPVIMVTLSHNDSVLLRAALPCASIAALQMYPFVTVLVSDG